MTGAQTLARSGLCVALMAVCAFLALPGPVPISLQSAGVFLSLLVLGGRRGTGAVAAYLLLGLAGAPVFAAFRGGPAVLFGPTGGYLWGFLLAAVLFWLLERRLRWLTLGFCQGMVWGFGAGWYAVVTHTGFWSAVTMGVLPFLVPDLVKLWLCCWLASRLP